jgi:leader peptidase (prepilin peptidase)/N-methyltransferase
MNGILSTATLSIIGACFGAIAGSFLNVVVHRVPRLIDAHDGNVSLREYIAGLAWPASHCPECSHPLAWRDNVPVLSYLALRGRCRFCHQSYGQRYLIIELLVALAFGYCVAIFGLTTKAFLAAYLLAGLVALVIIDIEEQLLPDIVLAPLFGLGFAFQDLYGGGLASAAFGAGAGYGALWLIREGYRLYAGVEGMGYGDVKFAGVLGAWLGASALPMMFAIAFASGVAFSLPLILTGRIKRQAAIPFGPFLAFSGACLFVMPSVASFFAGLFAVH